MEPSAGYTNSADGWYFLERGYPRVYTIADDVATNRRRVVTWKRVTTTRIATAGSSLLHWSGEFSQSKVTPSDTKWGCYARQIYQYVGVTNQTYWVAVGGYPSLLLLLHPTSEVPAPDRSFTLETYMTIGSNRTTFFGAPQRSLVRSDSPTLNFSITVTFQRLYQ